MYEMTRTKPRAASSEGWQCNDGGRDGGAAPVVAGDGSGGVPMLLGEVAVVGAAAATLAGPGVGVAAAASK